MKNKQIYFFIGTTAEFIKLAPVIKELKKRKINFKIITSGQSKILFEELTDYLGPMKADIAFNVKTYQLSILHFAIWTIRTFLLCLFSLHKEFKGLNNSNCYFIVHGDTISSLLGSIIAKVYGLRLVHIESGLRSFNFLEPFPEEINRFIISHLSDIRFCQNSWALNNIKKLSGININTKQNTLIESFWWAIQTKRNVNYIKKFNKYFIVYIRRQEHIFFEKEWTKRILEFVINNSDKNLNCIFILPPLTSKFFPPKELNLNRNLGKNLCILSRLPYVDFMKLMNNAEYIATDGCTHQEEAYYMGLPFLALRNRTERIEGLKRNVVISKGNKQIIKNFLKDYRKYKTKAAILRKKPSVIIVDYLLKH